MIENQRNSRKLGMEKYFFRAPAADLKKMPRWPFHTG